MVVDSFIRIVKYESRVPISILTTNAHDISFSTVRAKRPVCVLVLNNVV